MLLSDASLPYLFIQNLGLPELAIVLVVVLLFFGPGKLPQVGSALGNGIRQFKDALTGKPPASEPPALPADATPKE